MKCRLCGKEELEILTTKLRRGSGTVFYCPDCDYGMLEPSFSDASEYYDNDYREKFTDTLDEGKESPQEIFDMRKDYQEDRLKIISKYFDITKSFLEIGSSAGQFLSRIVGKFGTIAGIELDRSCAEFCKSLILSEGVMEPQIYTQSIEDLKWKEEQIFDYIGFFQVLEHIISPEVFMNCVRDRLIDDGRVFIEVPNLYDPLRVLWDVPAYEDFYFHEAHLSYFSEKSVRLLLEKCGFEVETVYYIQDYNLLNNLYWYFYNAPQKTCRFGLDKPFIEFKDESVGKIINSLLRKTNDEYFKILSENKLTSNMFVIARKG